MRHSYHAAIARGLGDTLACTVLIVFCATSPSAAQGLDAGIATTPGLDATIAELRRLIEDQRLALADQARLIDAQGRDIKALQQRLAPQASAVASAISPGAQPPPQGPRSPSRVPEMPTELVEAGDFPGSIEIPGTHTAFKLAGQARMMLVRSLAPIGSDEKFVTSSIPVADQQTAGDDSRTNFSPDPTRVNLDLRTKTEAGTVRTFVEGDFAGSGRTLRLRHAFIQHGRVLAGQTWSTFSDPEADPIGIDFEGLNAISRFRQPLVRFTQPVGPRFDVALALENPTPELTGAEATSGAPDVVARLRWQPERGLARRLLERSAHVQAAVLVRQLRGELTSSPGVTLSTGGVGANVSGVVTPRWDADDRIKFAGNGGWGIGRYITDLNALGGQDAIYDATRNSLRSLPVVSGYVGYERQWTPTFMSVVTYGIVNVENLDIQPAGALRRTLRGSVNPNWSPVPQADLVVEFLGGTRVNKNGERGSSSQLQAGWTFRF